MHLSQHFSLQELVFSQIAARAGIDNTPPPGVVDELAVLCDTILEPIRAHFGAVHVDSGYRCIELNRRLGSKDTSSHVLGCAADIVIPGVLALFVARWISSIGTIPFDQCIHENGWVHISKGREGLPPRHETLTIDKYGTRIGLLDLRP